MSVETQAQPVHKTVIGVCESVVIKGEWHEFNILQDGNTYPLKLSTKKQELITLGEALHLGKVKAEWGYLESRGNPNPHRAGQFYMNRWLDSAQPLNGDEPQADPATTPAMPHPAELSEAPPSQAMWDEKEARGHRRAAVAIAVSRAAQMTVPSGVDIFVLAHEIVDFTYGISRAEPADLIEGLAEENIPFE